jgi:hypothetical protein
MCTRELVERCFAVMHHILESASYSTPGCCGFCWGKKCYRLEYIEGGSESLLRSLLGARRSLKFQDGGERGAEGSYRRSKTHRLPPTIFIFAVKRICMALLTSHDPEKKQTDTLHTEQVTGQEKRACREGLDSFRARPLLIDVTKSFSTLADWLQCVDSSTLFIRPSSSNNG